MPVSLTLRTQPAVRPLQERRPHWQRLHAAAEDVRPQMATLWQTVLTDFRAGVSRRQLRLALQSHALLAVETLVQQHWERHVAQPVRQLLPALVTQAHDAGADATVPTLRRLADDATLTYTPGLTTQAITYSVGQQEQRIWQTTRLALREALRWSLAQTMSASSRAQWLHAMLGLTPRQVLSLERLVVPPTPLTTMARVTVPAEVRLHAVRARALRVQGIAMTQSYASVNMGAQTALEQSVHQGAVVSEELRRFWRVSQDERLCYRCLNIAQTHPLGVGVAQPFQTYAGPVMFPPVHVACRCNVALRSVRRHV